MEKENKNMTIDQLLQVMGNELGGEPETMKWLAQLDEKAVFEHAANKQFAMSGEKVPPKYKLLMSLAVSAALGVEHCIDTYTQVALRQGISKDEIMETLWVTRFVKGTTVISSATRALQMIAENEENKK
jgi:AhpD family alkylhydroperoxidase